MTPNRMIYLLRRMRGLTQTDVARRAHTCQSYIGQIERGERGLTPGMQTGIEAVFGFCLDDPEINAAMEAAEKAVLGGRSQRE